MPSRLNLRSRGTAAGILFLVIQSPDILILMRMTSDIATWIDYAGIDPFTGEEVYVAKPCATASSARALLRFFKLENYIEVRQAGRQDLIGSGCDALISSQPPEGQRSRLG